MENNSPVEEEEDQYYGCYGTMFDIQAILDKRAHPKNGSIEYLIRVVLKSQYSSILLIIIEWPLDPTWEPKNNIQEYLDNNELFVGDDELKKSFKVKQHRRKVLREERNGKVEQIFYDNTMLYDSQIPDVNFDPNLDQIEKKYETQNISSSDNYINEYFDQRNNEDQGKSFIFSEKKEEQRANDYLTEEQFGQLNQMQHQQQLPHIDDELFSQKESQDPIATKRHHSKLRENVSSDLVGEMIDDILDVPDFEDSPNNHTASRVRNQSHYSKRNQRSMRHNNESFQSNNSVSNFNYNYPPVKTEKNYCDNQTDQFYDKFDNNHQILNSASVSISTNHRFSFDNQIQQSIKSHPKQTLIMNESLPMSNSKIQNSSRIFDDEIGEFLSDEIASVECEVKYSFKVNWHKRKNGIIPDPRYIQLLKKRNISPQEMVDYIIQASNSQGSLEKELIL